MNSQLGNCRIAELADSDQMIHTSFVRNDDGAIWIRNLCLLELLIGPRNSFRGHTNEQSRPTNHVIITTNDHHVYSLHIDIASDACHQRNPVLNQATKLYSVSIS